MIGSAGRAVGHRRSKKDLIGILFTGYSSGIIDKHRKLKPLV
jgi:hypothetical protein